MTPREVAIEAAAKALFSGPSAPTPLMQQTAEAALDAILSALKATYGQDALLAMDGSVVRAEVAEVLACKAPCQHTIECYQYEVRLVAVEAEVESE